MSGEDNPAVALRRYIDSHYELGRHGGRPVALLRSREGVTDGPLWLDTPAGLSAWRYELLHGDRSTRWWNGTPLPDIERLVSGETLRQSGELASHGRELGMLSGEYGALVDLAEHRKWGLSDLKQRYRDRAINRALDEVLDQQDRERAMDEVAATFEWTDLSVDWDTLPPQPELLARVDGSCALYPGQRNFVAGHTESGKSWLLLMAVAQEVHAGRPVVWFDHENGEHVIQDRLRALGLTEDQVKTFVKYAFLTMPLPPAMAAEMATKLAAEGARLMVVDALTPVAAAMGLDTNGGDTGAVEEVFATVLDPWAQAGLAATILDNTPRANKFETLGSQHKSAGIGGVVLAVVAEERFSRGKAGLSGIYVVKDRTGSVDHRTVDDRRLWGTLHLSPEPVTGGVDAVITPPPEEPEAMEVLATAADRIVATLTLAEAALDRMGVSSTRSMRQLTEWMSVVMPLDPAFENAHTDRGYITDVLFKTSSEADRTAAGIRCVKETRVTKAKATRSSYLVERLGADR